MVRLETAYHPYPEQKKVDGESVAGRFSELIVDCRDPEKLAEVWCAVLDYHVIDRHEDAVEIAAAQPTAAGIWAEPVPPTLVFIRVPESKTVKNRLHIDVSPIDGEQQHEVDRLMQLGARPVDIGQGQRKWVVLADPEGNEFCVLRSLYQGR
jgi:hypothetical protein